ncbi:alpha/beta-hydrolase [Panus rudis PR-1116 ss-1]|nr:alpha/beta-hydrolase [Panus rudis PR-1116 ss-1]
MALSREVLTRVRDGHARQLAQFRIPDTERDAPQETLPFSSEDLVDWIKANPAAIQAAKDAQCRSTSSDTPNWDVILFALIESSAVYLRKRDSVFKAIEAANKGDFTSARQYLLEAQEYIDDVAAALDCTFVQLCDFAKVSPDGYTLHSGAYCGVFVSNDTLKPFMGVGYKGSSSLRDWVTDLDWTPLQAEGDIAFGSLVHQGFYVGLFGKFTSDGESMIPFEVMIGQLLLVNQQRENALLHFTGHSLGGAYCTLTYGEFLRRQNLLDTFNFGDMYSIAAPRTCLEPFAAEVGQRATTTTGRIIFRIVNESDPVPTIPPRTTDQLEQYPFVHVDGAWHIFYEKGPEPMASEQPPNSPVDPLPIPSIIWNATDHSTYSRRMRCYFSF